MLWVQLCGCFVVVLVLVWLARGNRQRLKFLHKKVGNPKPIKRVQRFALLVTLFLPFVFLLWQKDWAAMVVLAGGLLVAGWLTALTYAVRRG